MRVSRRKARLIRRWFRYHGMPVPWRISGFEGFDWEHPERVRIVLPGEQ
jgi:hypothetical protein